MLETSRFMRTELLLGAEKMQKLKNSTVMIVGVGAVGGYALEAVARSGVGNIILIDCDKFDETNINRQILALSSTIGQKKVDVAKKRVLDINPDCNVLPIDRFVDENNVSALLSQKIDYVIDAIDTVSSKCSLLEELTKKEINFISSMGASLRTDTSCIKLSTLDKTQNCGLAKTIRHRLRQKNIDIKRIKCVYSDEKTTTDSILQNNAKEEKSILGSLPTITAIFGLIMANEAIKFLTQNN